MSQLSKDDLLSRAKFNNPPQPLHWDYTKYDEELLRSQDIYGILQREYDGVTRLARFYTFIDRLNLKRDDISLIHLNADPFSAKMDDSSMSMGKSIFFSITPGTPEYKAISLVKSLEELDVMNGKDYDFLKFTTDYLSFTDMIEKFPFSIQDFSKKIEEKTMYLPHKSNKFTPPSYKDKDKNAKIFKPVQDYVTSVFDSGKTPVIISEYLFGNECITDSANWGDEYLSLEGVHLHYVSLPDMVKTLELTKGIKPMNSTQSIINTYLTELCSNARMPRVWYKDRRGKPGFTYYAFKYFEEPRKPSEVMAHWIKYPK